MSEPENIWRFDRERLAVLERALNTLEETCGFRIRTLETHEVSGPGTAGELPTVIVTLIQLPPNQLPTNHNE